MLERLPDDVLNVLLEFIGIKQLVNLQLCSRWLNKLVRAFSPAMYRIECSAAGVYDNRRSEFTHAERRDLLRRREMAWQCSNTSKGIRFAAPFEAIRTYDLDGGCLFLQKEGLEPPFIISALDLASLYDQPDSTELQWQSYEFPTEIIGHEAATEAYDLIVAVTMTPGADWEGEVILNSVIIHLLSASTGSPHPLAQIPSINLTLGMAVLITANALIEVLGDWLILFIVSWDMMPHERYKTDQLYFVNWKTGKEKLVADFRCCTHQGMALLSENLIMLPNMRTFALDIYSITIDSFGDVSLAKQNTLELPAYRQELFIKGSQCRAEPSIKTTGSAVPAFGRRPFHNRPEDSIIVCAFEFYDQPTAATLVVHRKTILAALADFLRAGDEADSLIPYDRWAAGRCFWTLHKAGWIAQSAGQRFVSPTLPLKPDSNVSFFCVWDFNPHSVYGVQWPVEDGSDGFTRDSCKTTPSIHSCGTCPLTRSCSDSQFTFSVPTIRFVYLRLALSDLRSLTFSFSEVDIVVSTYNSTVTVRYGRDLWEDLFIFDQPVACGLPYIQTTFKGKHTTRGFIMDDRQLLSIEESNVLGNPTCSCSVKVKW